MEIRPILSAMLRNKTGAFLIAAQIAVTLAIVVNCMHMIHSRLKQINRETGMDTENIVTVRTASLLEDFDSVTAVQRDRERLLSIPGVTAVTPISQFPLSGSGSNEGFRGDPDPESPRTGANYYYVDEHAIEALGVKLIEGRNFTPAEVQWAKDEREMSQFPKQVIITKALANKVFEDGNALGKSIYNNLGNAAEVIGIIELMQGAWVSWDGLEQVMLQPKVSHRKSPRYLMRTEPGAAAGIAPLVEEAWSDDRSRLVSGVDLLSELKERSYSDDSSLAKLLTIVIGLLLAVTALGIVGLASFSVRQRTKQIGTRRAIGARKFHILRYFLTENWLVTTIGVVVGTGLAIGLNLALVNAFEMEKLDMVYVPVGILGLWALGLLAVLGPARKASTISPAIATRTV